MNHDLLLRVADAIEADPAHFNMADFGYHSCGTRRCIAGYAIAIGLGEDAYADALARTSVPFIARDVLELTVDEADELFYAEWDDHWEADDHGGRQPLSATADEAADEIRLFVARDRGEL